MNQPKRVPNAEQKLDAAIFFLEQLQRAQEDPRAFYYYASAVLNAARCVDYALRYEAGDRYRNWLDSWLAALPAHEQAFARGLIGMRNADIHGEGMPVLLTMDIATISANSIIAGFVGTGLKAADLAEIWVSLPQAADPKPTGLSLKLTYEFVGQGPPQDVVEACNRFVDLSKRLLNDFRSA